MTSTSTSPTSPGTSSLNPFPQLAVASGSLAGLPDYRGSILGTGQKLIDVWQGNLATAPGLKGGSSTTPAGLVISVRGRFGSGKTHLVLQMMNAFQEITAKWAQTSLLVSKQMYIQPDTLDPEVIYKNEIAGRLTDDELLDLVARHAQQLVVEKTSGAASNSLGTMARERIVSLQATQPRLVLDLLQANLLPVSGIEQGVRDRFESVRSEVKRVETASSLSQDYSRAYSWILNPSHGAAARKWIRGQALTADEAGQLSISLLSIQGKTDSQAALEFLLRAYRKAGCLLMLCLDEIERFVMPGGEIRRSEQLTMLKMLVETVTATGHCIVVSGSEDAWEAARYRRDVTDRFPQATVLRVVLERNECKELLGVYCKSVGKELANVFVGDDAVKAVIEAGEFTARRMLSLAHDAFQEAGGAPISAQLIETLSARGDVLKRIADAAREAVDIIREEAAVRGMVVREGFIYAGKTFDFAIRRSDQKRIGLLVQIVKATYRMDEASKALATTEATRLFSSANPSTKTCQVLIGYSSEAVRDQLAKAIDKVIPFNAQTFRSEFTDLLMDLDASSPRAPVQSATYQEVEQQLGAIGELAGTDAQKLNEEVTALNAVKTQQYDRERQVRVAERFEAVLLDLKEWVRQLKEESDETANSATPSPAEQLRILSELNRILPEEHRMGRLLSTAKAGILVTKPNRERCLFVLEEISRLNTRRAASLRPSFIQNWDYRFNHISWPGRVALVAVIAISIAMALWVSFSLPDPTAYKSYKEKLTPLFHWIQGAPRSFDYQSTGLKDLLTQRAELEATAWQAGITPDPVFQQLDKILDPSMWGDSRTPPVPDIFDALNRARSDNRLAVTIRARLRDWEFQGLLGCVELCFAYPVVILSYRLLRRRKYGLA
jgi:hypothetical protein